MTNTLKITCAQDVYVMVYVSRWEVIANFIGQHVAGSDKNAKDVLSKAKELQKNGMMVSCFTLLVTEHVIY